jgi:hypothetical protein
MPKAAFDTGANTKDSTTTPAITLPNPCDVLAFVVSEGADAAPTMSDSKTNVYTLIGTRQITGDTPSYLHCFRAFKKIGGAGFTVTAAKTDGYSSLIVLSLTGGRAIKIVETKQAVGLASGEITVRPFNGGNVLVGVAAAGFPDQLIAFTWPEGWTEFLTISADVGSEWAMGVAYKSVVAHGPQEFSTELEFLGDPLDADPPYAVTLLNLGNFSPATGGTGNRSDALSGVSGLIVGDGL